MKTLFATLLLLLTCSLFAQDRTGEIIRIVRGGQDSVYNPPIQGDIASGVVWSHEIMTTPASLNDSPEFQPQAVCTVLHVGSGQCIWENGRWVSWEEQQQRRDSLPDDDWGSQVANVEDNLRAEVAYGSPLKIDTFIIKREEHDLVWRSNPQPGEGISTEYDTIIYNPLHGIHLIPEYDYRDCRPCVHAVNIPHHCCVHPSDSLLSHAEAMFIARQIHGNIYWEIDLNDSLPDNSVITLGVLDTGQIIRWNGSDWNASEVTPRRFNGQLLFDGNEVEVIEQESHTYHTHENGTKYRLHAGALGAFYYYDSSGPSAAGWSTGAIVTYNNDNGFWAQGQGGYAELFRPEQNQRILQFSGAIGYAQGPFALGLDIGNVQFLDGPDESAISVGVVGQFAVPISPKMCILAGMRAGVLTLEATTVYQMTYLGVQYSL